MRKSPKISADFIDSVSKYSDVNKAHINEACKKWQLY